VEAGGDAPDDLSSGGHEARLPIPKEGHMRRIRNARFGIRAKLLTLSAVLLALLAVVAVAALAGLADSRRAGDHLYRDGTVPTAAVGTISGALVDSHRSLLRQLYYPDDPAVATTERATRAADAATITRQMAILARIDLPANARRDLARVGATWPAYRRLRDRVLAQSQAGDQAAARATLKQALAQITAARTALRRVTASIDRSSAALADGVETTYRDSRTLTLVLLAAAIALGLGLALLVAGRLSRGVARLVAVADGLAEGDLDQRVEVSGRDELTTLAHAFERMVDGERRVADAADRIAEGDLTVEVQPRSERDVLGRACARMTQNLRDLVGRVTATAGSVSASSRQMAGISEEAGRAVGEIANAVGDVAAGAERQVRMVEDTRANAEETDRAARSAREMADTGAHAAERASAAMAAVSASSETVTTAIRALAQKSGEISGIVATITGIAEQTNLLALNAAIEAARAGDQGRGFAVVADEVRKLAEESQEAAGDIEALIAEIQAETTRSVDVVDDSARRSQEGTAVVEEAREAFARIAAAVRDVSDRVAAIVASTTEVAAVAEESSASSEQVSASSQETSASTQEIAATAQQLAANAQELDTLVSSFRVAAA